jgi:hypothetical protein
VRECCERAWLACSIDSKGSIQVWRQSSTAVSTRAYGLRVVINNSDDAYISRVLGILSNIGVSNWKTSRRTSAIGTKDVCEVKVAELDSIIKVLSTTMEFLTSKRDFAEAALSLALMRKQSRNLYGQRAQWTDIECDLAESIRSKFMPNSLAYGETLPTSSKSRVIPSQALGSVDGSTKEALETRTTSNACSNWSHECPAAVATVEDIVQTSRKLESRDKELGEDIGTN